MKTYARNSRLFLAAAVLGLILNLLPLAVPVRAQNVTWSAWQPLGDNISVSFSQIVGSTSWTWKFRNDGSQAITYMDYYYTDNTGQHTDVFPGTLQPGQAFGGWAAFMSSSIPTVQLKSVQYANSASATNTSSSSSLQNSGTSTLASSQTNGQQNLQDSHQRALTQQQLAAQQDIANAQADLAAATAFQADLSAFGKWMNLNGQTYWQPTEAAGGGNWRPYCTDGNWVYTDDGWTWNSDYDWGWAAFHYGRWADDPVLGWIWQPGSVWAPAWVAWRGNDAYCGWAPLPPGAGYDVTFGFTYRGMSVSMDFGFGLGADDYCFISISDMCNPNYNTYLVPATQANIVYRQTTVVGNAYVSRGGRIVNTGVAVEKVGRLTHRDIRPLKLADAGVAPGRSHINGDSLVVHRASFHTTSHVLDDLTGPGKELQRPAPASVDVRPNRANNVLDDLISDNHPQHQPSRANSVMEDLIGSKHAQEPVATASHRSSNVIDDILSGGHSESKSGYSAKSSASHSDAVMSDILSRGHTAYTPPAVNGTTSRTVASSSYGSAAAGSYGQTVNRPVQQNSGTVQPVYQQQPVNQWQQQPANQSQQDTYQPTQNGFQQTQDNQQALEEQRQRNDQAQEEARQRAEEARQQSQEEARQRAEEQQQAQEEVRQRAEAAQQQAQEEARQRAEEQQQAQEEARQRAEQALEEARQRAEEEARRLQEEQQTKKPY